MLKNILLTLYIMASIAAFLAVWVMYHPLAAWCFAGVACAAPVVMLPKIEQGG